MIESLRIDFFSEILLDLKFQVNVLKIKF